MMKRSATVVAVCLPGALMAGWFGLMVAAFAGDAGPTDFAQKCWFVWGGFGGACLGALPGLILGVILRVKWVAPFLGAAVGALPGLAEATEMGIGIHPSSQVWRLLGEPIPVRFVDLAGFTSAGFLIFGFVAGLLWWIKTTVRKGNRD